MRQIILTITASIPLVAQDPLIYIYREPVKPGRLAKLVEIEEAAARFCARVSCPNPYLAISSLTGPNEVWWINGFDSPESMQKVWHEYAASAEITRELNDVAERKADSLFPPSSSWPNSART